MALIKLNTRSLSDNSVTNEKLKNPKALGSHRRLNYNGAFDHWQRGVNENVTVAGTYETADRFKVWASNVGGLTCERSSDTPSGQGFRFSMKMSPTTGDASLGSGEYACFALHKFEGERMQDWLWATANAKDLYVSFWVKSNKTGTYSLIGNTLNGTNYKHIKEYTINSANTWEKKTIIIPGLTALSGATISNDNNASFRILFNLGWGDNNSGTADTWFTGSDYTTSTSVNFMDSSSNEMYITGIQYEFGEHTDFEFWNQSEELNLCKRYYFTYGGTHGAPLLQGYDGGNTTYTLPLPVRMRTSPSGTNYGNWYRPNATLTGVVHSNSEFMGMRFNVTSTGGWECYPQNGTNYDNNPSHWQYGIVGHIACSAEI